jgi:Tol biopolymer transport system component
MRANPAGILLICVGGVGCLGSDATGYTPPPRPIAPELESVAYDLLGSGKVAFTRLGPTENQYHATYIIDGSARTSRYVLDTGLVYGPALSPDGQKLAFNNLDLAHSATLDDVYIANADGTNVQLLWKRAGSEGPPLWSPDGTKILVAAAAPGNYNPDIYSLSPAPDQPNPTRLTSFVVVDEESSCPIMDDVDNRVSMSSKGQFVFPCVRFEINVLSSSGDLAAKYRSDRANLSHWESSMAAAWSPDGTRVAFIQAITDSDHGEEVGDEVTSLDLKLMDADGTNVTTISTFPVNGPEDVAFSWAGHGNFSLCWMPDGSRIVLSVPEGRASGHIWVVKVDGSGKTQLTSRASVWDRSVSCSRS